MENTMLLRKRRVDEEWNLAPGAEIRDGRPPFIERISNNTKIWAIFALCSTFICALMVVHAFKIDNSSAEIEPRQVRKKIGTYNDSEHRDFLQSIVKRQKRQGLNISAEYLSDDEILIIVPPDTAWDDIQFLVRFAGIGSMNRFGMVPVVTVKTSSRPDGLADKLVATGSWSERDNDYNITFHKG